MNGKQVKNLILMQCCIKIKYLIKFICIFDSKYILLCEILDQKMIIHYKFLLYNVIPAHAQNSIKEKNSKIDQ